MILPVNWLVENSWYTGLVKNLKVSPLDNSKMKKEDAEKDVKKSFSAYITLFFEKKLVWDIRSMMLA